MVGVDNNQLAVFFGPQGVLALQGCSENSKHRSERSWAAAELLILTTA